MMTCVKVVFLLSTWLATLVLQSLSNLQLDSTSMKNTTESTRAAKWSLQNILEMKCDDFNWPRRPGKASAKAVRASLHIVTYYSYQSLLSASAAMVNLIKQRVEADENLKEACSESFYVPGETDAKLYSYSGYGHVTYWECTMKDLSNIKCQCTNSKKKETAKADLQTHENQTTQAGLRDSLNCLDPFVIKYGGGAPTRLAVAWTDKKGNVLYVACASNNRMLWYLVSASPFVSKKLQKSVLKKVTGMGFDPKKAIIAPFDDCPTPQETT